MLFNPPDLSPEDRKFVGWTDNSSPDEEDNNSPPITPLTHDNESSAATNVATVTPAKPPVLTTTPPAAAAKPLLNSTDDDNSGIANFIKATVGTVDVAGATSDEEGVQQPPAKRFKTEEGEIDQVNDSSPKPPLPKHGQLRKLESTDVDMYAPSAADDDRYTVVVFGLSKHYAVVDIHQGIRSAFLNPVHKILTTDPQRGTKLFRAVDLLFSCEPGHPNNVRKSDPAQQKFFPWKILIIHRNANESLQELQKDVISRLTHYANTHHGTTSDENFRNVPEFCAGSILNEDLQLPWNHYIQNKSVLRFLKRYYSRNTRQDIMANPEVLKRYFGSVEEGRSHLNMSELEWLKL